MRRSAAAQTNDIAIDLSKFPGSFSERLQAVQSAGFSRILLSARDLVNHPCGLAQAVNDLKAMRLEVVALRGLDDHSTNTAQHRRFKTEMARAMLGLCKSIQAPLLVARYEDESALDESQSEQRVEDLRRLALLAIPCNVRIAYEPSSVHTAAACGLLDIVQQVDMPNVGVSLDLLDERGQDVPLADEPEALSLVYLLRVGDLLPTSTDAANRVFPGEGLLAELIAERAKALDRLGYRGRWAFDVNHPDYACVCAAVAAKRAARSARWLAEDVLRRSVPLPKDVLENVVSQMHRSKTDPINNP